MVIVPMSTVSPKLPASPSSASSARRELRLLALDPLRPAALLGPQEGLVAGQHRGIEDAVALGLAAKRLPARRPGAGKHLRPVVQAVQILADHARVVEHGAVVGDQAGDLAERIVPVEVGVGLDRRHLALDQLEPVAQPGLDRHRHDLAHVRRGDVVVELHAACLRSPGPDGPDHRISAQVTASAAPRVIGTASSHGWTSPDRERRPALSALAFPPGRAQPRYRIGRSRKLEGRRIMRKQVIVLSRRSVWRRSALRPPTSWCGGRRGTTPRRTRRSGRSSPPSSRAPASRSSSPSIRRPRCWTRSRRRSRRAQPPDFAFGH